MKCVGACGLVAQCDEYQLVVRYTCCVIDCTHIPIIHTHNGDGTFQNTVEVDVKRVCEAELVHYAHDPN
jgi:hypothetical protein